MTNNSINKSFNPWMKASSVDEDLKIMGMYIMFWVGFSIKGVPIHK